MPGNVPGSASRRAREGFNVGSIPTRDLSKLQISSEPPARTLPLRFSYLRGHDISNTDLSVIKRTEIREGQNLEFRAEFINAFNHPLFNTDQIVIDPTSAAFGRFNSQTQRNYARRIQMTLKFTF
jgi:hypothetical protein